jgi:DNA polymerase-3 subunit beta
LKFRCERDVLVEALSTTNRAAAGKGTGPVVLSGIQLNLTGDHLHLVGNDRDLTIETTLTVSGAGDGAAVVPARLTVDIVRSLEPGAVTFETGEDDVVHITAGRSQFLVRSLPVDEFPRPSVPSGEPVMVDASLLASALRQVVRAASSDDSRPVLTAVLMAADENGLRLVATDSYRLAVRELPGSTMLQAGQRVLIPSRALSELQRLLPPAGEGQIGLRLGEFEATFDLGPTRLTTRLLQGDFPNHASLIQSHYPCRLVVGREPLADALKRVRLMVRDANTSVRISLRADGAELTVITPDLGQASEDVDAKYEGAEMTIAFNPTYLLEGLEAIDGDEVVLEAQDSTKAATLRGLEAPEYLYLVMPVRIP